jgi:hypothetical protein
LFCIASMPGRALAGIVAVAASRVVAQTLPSGSAALGALGQLGPANSRS